MTKSQTNVSSHGMPKSHDKKGYQRLPSQQSVRVFEAAARHLSFTRAGQELALTQSGVSKQIKGLEAFLGVLLFNREAQQLMLTEEGKQFLCCCIQALDCLQQGVKEVKGDSGVLRLQAPPSFVVRWLIPKMELLRRTYPELELRIETTWTRTIHDRIQLQANELVIHACFDYEAHGINSELLRKEDLYIMVSPQYIAEHGCINNPLDLIGKTLIHTKIDGHIHWDMWTKSLGINHIDISQGYEFETLDMALAAAENGVGVVICDLIYALKSLRSGRLIIPFKTPPVSGLSYFLLSKEDPQASKLQRYYRQWLKKEIAEGEQEMRLFLDNY
ncbi:LysR substrate-binding domain-containing protein [Marinomonas sp.]|nr:LysR substrate-binding domain-containing protein [Marinomonas sp.]MDB4837041.1 LysR substrate-binding domain-containing protein [Marinomonas sp.]